MPSTLATVVGPRRQHIRTYSPGTMGSFGSGAEPAPRQLVANTQGIAAPVHRGVAREVVTFQVDGDLQEVEVIRQVRRFGGSQAYWRCGQCSALRSHLYVVAGVLACRCCHQLSYRRVPSAVARAAKIRRRLGGVPGLLSPIPRQPRHWHPAHYRRLVAELIEAERVIARMLHGTVAALERRKGRLHRGREQRS